MHSKITFLQVLTLLGVYLIYSLSGVCTKYASMQEFLSLAYFGYFAASIAVMGIFAIAWQQVLRHVELATAFMFKGVFGGYYGGIFGSYSGYPSRCQFDCILSDCAGVTGAYLCSRLCAWYSDVNQYDDCGYNHSSQA